MSDTRIIRVSQSKPFAVGKMPFDLDTLPKGYRITDVMVELDGTLNVPAAGVTSDQLTRLVDIVESDRRLRSDGLGLSALDWQQQGKDLVRPADIAVGAAQPINMVWPLGWKDERGIDPGDSPPATDFYAGKTLDIYWKDPTTLVAALAVNAGTNVQVTFHMEPLPWLVVPTSVVIGYQEFTGKETKLPAGSYVDLILQKLDGSAITDAELGNVRISEDGRFNILEGSTRLRQLVRSFNRHIARGAQVQGATSGVEGEALDEASVPFVPLLHPLRPFKATKLPTAQSTLFLTIDGTLAAGSARIYYRLLELRDKANVKRAAARLGYPEGAVRPKTASKQGVNAKVRGFLSGMAQRIVPGASDDD